MTNAYEKIKSALEKIASNSPHMPDCVGLGCTCHVGIAVSALAARPCAYPTIASLPGRMHSDEAWRRTCDGLRAELDHRCVEYRTLSDYAEQMEVERVEAVRACGLAQEASTRDLESKRAVEAKLAQVDDVLIVNWVGPRKDGNYRKAIADLIATAIQEHDDPSMSEVAGKRCACHHPESMRCPGCDPKRVI